MTALEKNSTLSKLETLSTEIASFYPDFQQKKKFDDWYKEILKEKFEALGQEKVVCLGIIHHWKTRTKWKWKDEVYDYLEKENVLASAVSIKEKNLTRYNLDSFKLPATESLRITAKRLTDAEKNTYIAKEIEKITKKEFEYTKGEDLELKFKDLLREKTFEEVISLFKINKMLIKQLEQKYENRRDLIFKSMDKAQLKDYKSSSGYSLKISTSKADFDTEAIVISQIPKYYSLSYKMTSKEGDVTVIDLLNDKHEFSFKNETMYEGHRLSLYKGRLHVDGQRLRTDPREIFKSQDGFYPANGEIFVDSNELLRNCPISATNIDQLLDIGLLDMRTVESFKYKESEEDVTRYFEVISEVADEARKTMFKDKLEARLALQKQKTVPVYHETDYQDDDSEIDLFELQTFI